MSTERIIVVEAVADAFVEQLATLPHGNPRGQAVLGLPVSLAAAQKWTR
ncbi:hypothetical protein [Mangrovicoccus sp. HB161399]|nr:hypothetical protein [Mangrovicoccus sp. HB161399]